MATYLITSSDIINYCRVSSNLPAAQFTRFIRESQIFDIQPLIGQELLEDLLAEIDVSPELSTTKLYDLYYGKTYLVGTTYYRTEGIQMLHAYCAYKRILEENSINLTAFGVVQKIDELSQPITDGQMNMILSKVNEKVIALKAQIYDYLCAHSTTYTEWKGWKNKRNINIKLIGE